MRRKDIVHAGYALALVTALGSGAAFAADAPTVNLKTSTGAVVNGGTATLTWSSTNATACVASDAWSGNVGLSGTQTTRPLTQNSVFILTCSGDDSSSTVVKAGINVIPTASLSATPAALSSGASATLVWSSTNAASCTAGGGWSGTLATNGSRSTGPLTKNTSYSLTCVGAAGAGRAVTATVDVSGTAAPTASLLSSAGAVASGGSATLTWSSSNATACVAGDAWSGSLAPSGSKSTGPLTKNSTFTLRCTSTAGTSPLVKAGINVVPTVTLAANPASVASGGAATLTWNSANATSCTASGGWSGSRSTSGTASTGALTQNKSYSIGCQGPAGASRVATAAVTVTNGGIPTATLTTSTGAVPNGGAATLTWSSTNATSCTASGAWSGTLAAKGSQSTGALTKNSTFALSCSGAGGVSPTVKAGINVVPTVTSFTANPTSINSGADSTLTWNSANATSCSASGGWSGSLAASGSRSTGALTKSTTYSISCTGPAGTSSVSSVTVSLSNGTVSVSPKIAALTVSQSRQFAAQAPAGSSFTWTVDGIKGGNSAAGLVSATGLYTAGTSPGSHTVGVTASGGSGGTQSASAVGAVTDLAGVYTYHNDLARDGANSHEYALSTKNVNTSTFGKIASCAVDGAIYGQPLWVANVVLGGTRHNVVIVATQHDSLYAFDGEAAPCSKLWSVSLIDAAHGGSSGETSVPYTLVGIGEGDIQPEVGVTGTPVIDPATNIVYVVSKSVSAAQTTFYQRLHAIDLASGAEKTGSPATIAGTYPGKGDGGSTVTFNPRQELQRTGLALVKGLVYVAFTAHEDAAPWYGWMMSYQYDGTALKQKSVLNVAPNLKRGGIWMSGGAPAADSDNNIYVLTGNGDFNAANSTAPNNDYGDSLLELTPTLSVSQYFTPSDQLSDVENDSDFGAGGAAMLADLPAGNTVTHALIAGGKDGNLFVLNRDMLGGFGDAVAVQKIQFGHPMFATGAFANNNLYIGGVSGPLTQFALTTKTAHFALASQSTHVYGFAGATPSVSSSAAANGVVWALDTGSYCTHQAKSCGPVVLYAYDASNLGVELWNSSSVAANAAGYAIKFTVPTVANGRVYVGTRGDNKGKADDTTSTPGELDIYGLKP